jgi:hypothetical protein
MMIVNRHEITSVTPQSRKVIVRWQGGAGGTNRVQLLCCNSYADEWRKLGHPTSGFSAINPAPANPMCYFLMTTDVTASDADRVKGDHQRLRHRPPDRVCLDRQCRPIGPQRLHLRLDSRRRRNWLRRHDIARLRQRWCPHRAADGDGQRCTDTGHDTRSRSRSPCLFS